MEPELDNFRAAMDWALIKQATTSSLGRALVAALRELWIGVGSRTEGARWIKLALDAQRDARAGRGDRSSLWIGFAMNNEGVRRRAARSRPNVRSQAEQVGRSAPAGARPSGNWALRFDRRGRFDDAEAEYVQSGAPAARDQDDQEARLVPVVVVHHLSGSAATQEAAQKGFDEALPLAKSFGDEQMTATVLGNVAELNFSQGDIDEGDRRRRRGAGHAAQEQESAAAPRTR